jgi:hypothetical protein
MSETSTATATAAPAASAAEAATGTTGTVEQTTAPATTAGQSAAAATEGAAWDGQIESLPGPVQKIIRDLRDENATRRANTEKAAEDARATLTQEIGKALGLIKGDEAPDAAKLTESLTAAQAESKATRLELAIYKAAAAAGVKPDALTDSRTFMTKVADLDPANSQALAAAIADAVETNPSLKAQPGAARVGGAQIAGGASKPSTYTATQIADPEFYRAHREDILRAAAEGRITG